MDENERHHEDTDEPCASCGARWSHDPAIAGALVMQHEDGCGYAAAFEHEEETGEGS